MQKNSLPEVLKLSYRWKYFLDEERYLIHDRSLQRLKALD